MNKLIVLVIVVLLGAGTYYFYMQQQPEPVEPEAPLLPTQAPARQPAADSSPPADVAAPAETTQVEESAEAVEEQSLPPLQDSDPVVRESLAASLGDAAVMQYLVNDDVVSRAVAVIDSLMARQVPAKLMPVQAPGGELIVTEHNNSQQIMRTPEGDVIQQYRVDSANYQRYTPYVELLESIDAADMAARYAEFEPLFDQAYTELGYPDGGFTRRMVEVIDHLLAAPLPAEPPVLIKPEAYYLFADAEYENLTAGQKLMIRMGPDNERRVKVKLRQLRDTLSLEPY